MCATDPRKPIEEEEEVSSRAGRGPVLINLSTLERAKWSEERCNREGRKEMGGQTWWTISKYRWIGYVIGSGGACKPVSRTHSGTSYATGWPRKSCSWRGNADGRQQPWNARVHVSFVLLLYHTKDLFRSIFFGEIINLWFVRRKLEERKRLKTIILKVVFFYYYAQQCWSAVWIHHSKVYGTGGFGLGQSLLAQSVLSHKHQVKGAKGSMVPATCRQ